MLSALSPDPVKMESALLSKHIPSQEILTHSYKFIWNVEVRGQNRSQMHGRQAAARESHSQNLRIREKLILDEPFWAAQAHGRESLLCLASISAWETFISVTLSGSRRTVFSSSTPALYLPHSSNCYFFSSFKHCSTWFPAKLSLCAKAT